MSTWLRRWWFIPIAILILLAGVAVWIYARLNSTSVPAWLTSLSVILQGLAVLIAALGGLADFTGFNLRELLSRRNRSKLNLLADVRKWIDRCHDFVVDKEGERRAHICGHQATLVSQVSPEWWRAHKALDEHARVIELELEDRVLPRVQALDPQLADTLRHLGNAFGKLRWAIRDVWSDRNPQSEYDQVMARLDAILASKLGGKNGLEFRPCPLCDAVFRSRQDLFVHFTSDHPRPPLSERILIDPVEHHARIDRAVRVLRELIRQAESLLAR